MFEDMPRGRPSTTPRSPFGERLAAARQRAGLSQAELGEKLGLSQRAIAHWERRDSSLYPEQIATLCRVLDVAPAELLGLEEQRNRSGRPSALQKQIAQVEQLPRKDQLYVSRFLDQVLTQKHDSAD